MTAPWRIGWFGVIRCRRSLALLAALAQPGLVEVVIRGRPAPSAVPEFDRVVAATPGLTFLGGYDRGVDLARIYGAVDFTWAMDFFEADGSSDWLLPNRLYEGGLFGSVALALRSTQTGAWLAARQAGVLLDEPLERTLPAWFAELTPARYELASTAIPRQDVVCDTADCRQLVAELASLPRGRRSG